MPAKKRTSGQTKRPIERYEHSDKKRINNPPVGLVTPETDPVVPTDRTYDYVKPVPSVNPRQELDYDPHLDPQLVWAGKKETCWETKRGPVFMAQVSIAILRRRTRLESLEK